MALDFLYLNEPDMIEAGVLDEKRCIDASKAIAAGAEYDGDPWDLVVDGSEAVLKTCFKYGPIALEKPKQYGPAIFQREPTYFWTRMM